MSRQSGGNRMDRSAFARLVSSLVGDLHRHRTSVDGHVRRQHFAARPGQLKWADRHHVDRTRVAQYHIRVDRGQFSSRVCARSSGMRLFSTRHGRTRRGHKMGENTCRTQEHFIVQIESGKRLFFVSCHEKNHLCKFFFLLWTALGAFCEQTSVVHRI